MNSNEPQMHMICLSSVNAGLPNLGIVNKFIAFQVLQDISHTHSFEIDSP